MATDRNGLQVLDVDQCLHLLETHVPHVGRVAVIEGTKPVMLPVNYVYFEGAIVFRSDPGAKLAAAAQRANVAFEVDEIDTAWQEGWSIVIQGRAEEVTDPAEVERLRELPLKPWGPGPKMTYIRILPSEISGRSLA